MYLIITLAVILLFIYLFSYLAKKSKIPEEVALILGGILISFPLLKEFVLGPNTEVVFALGDIALIALMFLAGLETSWKMLYKERKDESYIALFATIIPFLIGFLIFYLMDYSLLVSFIVGICISITAEGATAELLIEMKKIRTKVGEAIMGAGILDDIFGLTFFLFITYVLHEVNIRDAILLIGAVVAFFLGIYIAYKVGRKHYVIQKIEKLLVLFLIPFFFISIGTHFDIDSIFVNPLLLILIIIIALAGKFAGVFAAKPFTSLNWRQMYIVGWAMNSRGAVEMVLVLIAFRSGVIPVELYSSLIVMALFTTLIFPFFVTRTLKKYPKLMN